MKYSTLNYCFLAALLAAGQAFAHTGVRDKVVEGTSIYTAFSLTHGCASGSAGHQPVQSYPVVGQSAVFPYGNNVVWRDKAGAIIQKGGNGNDTISVATLSLGVSGVDGGTVFKTIEEIVNSEGVVQGLLWKDGVLAPQMATLPLFRVTAPKIANNCVENLKIRIGVVNYCDVGKTAADDGKGPYKAPKDLLNKKIKMVNSEKTGFKQKSPSQVSQFFEDMPKGNGDNNRADWWFTALDGGSIYYNDPDVLQPTFWTTMTVTNTPEDLAKCTGTKTDVSVEPNGAAFDEILSPANTQPFVPANAQNNL